MQQEVMLQPARANERAAQQEVTRQPDGVSVGSCACSMTRSHGMIWKMEGNRVLRGVCVDLASGGRGSFINNQDYQVPPLIPSPPPRHLITKLKGSTESHFCIPRFPSTRLTSLLSEKYRGGGTAAAKGRQSHPLKRAQMFSPHSL